jgi:hypothetical protein
MDVYVTRSQSFAIGPRIRYLAVSGWDSTANGHVGADRQVARAMVNVF